MSDLLHDAVQAEIDAYSPRSAPPFEALVARKLARGRRGRAVAGGVALSVVAVATAALVVPTLGAGGDRLVTSPPSGQAGPGGVEPQTGPVREYSIRNRADIGFAPAVRETDRGIRGCLELPGVVGRSTGEGYPGDYVASAVGEVAEQLESCIRDVPGAVAALKVGSSPVRALPELPEDLVGAEICRTEAASGGECYDTGPSQAEELAAALATAQPGGGVQCLSTPGAIYRITWLLESGLVDSVAWNVPTVDCVPMEVAGSRYDLPPEAHNLVARAWSAAGVSPVDGRVPPATPRN